MKRRPVTMPPAVVVNFFFIGIVKVLHPPSESVIAQFFFFAKGSISQLLCFRFNYLSLVKSFTEQEKIMCGGIDAFVTQNVITCIKTNLSPPAIIGARNIWTFKIEVNDSCCVAHSQRCEHLFF